MNMQDVRTANIRVQPHFVGYDPAPRRDLNLDAPATNL